MEALRQLLGSKADEEIMVEQDKKDDKQEVKNQEQPEKKAPAKPEKVGDEISNTEQVETNKETVDEVVEEGGTKVNIFEDGWFNQETGKIDESKIKNPEVLGAIQQIQAKYKQEKDSRLISDKLNDELKNYSLNVSEDMFRRVLNLNDVKISKDGEVTGVKEAIESLKTAEPAFFKDKEKESNPLNEGFNPVEKKNTGAISSFDQAFRLMEEISN